MTLKPKLKYLVSPRSLFYHKRLIDNIQLLDEGIDGKVHIFGCHDELYRIFASVSLVLMMIDDLDLGMG